MFGPFKEQALKILAACREGDLGLCRSLLEDAGGNRNAILAWRDSEGVTLLQDAVMHMSEGVVRCLLEAGANPNESGKDAQALYWAAKRGDVGIVAALVEFGADLNAPKLTDGVTPLMAAVCKSKSGAALFLIGKGARSGAAAGRGGNWSAADFVLTDDDPALFMALYRAGEVRLNESVLAYVLRGGALKVLRACLNDPDLRAPAEGEVLSPDLLANCWTNEVRQALLSWHSEKLITAVMDSETAEMPPPRQKSALVL